MKSGFASLRFVRMASRLSLPAVLILLAAMGVASAAASKPGITVSVSPASQSVVRGSTATYAVSVASTSGFAGAVTMSVSGVPSGATSAFSPASVTLTSGSSANTTLTVSTTSGTPVSSYTLTITGTSGKTSGSVTAGLTVNYPISSSMSISATPSSVSVSAGSSGAYTIQLSRTNIGAATLSIAGGLPTGASATFTPNPVPTTTTSSTLQIATAATTPDGTYTLYLVASGQNSSGQTQYAYATVQFVVNTTASPFTISGSLGTTQLLAPGTSFPLNLTISNPNKKPLSVTNLSVAVQTVTRTSFAISHNQPCTIGDYKVNQFSGGYPFTIAGNSSASLSSLGFSTAAMPQLTMFNATTNQDGCKGATITLAYSGSGQGT